MNTSVAFLLAGSFCEFVFIAVPRRWTLTKVGFMVWKRWGDGRGDWDMYNKFGKILYVATILGMGIGMVSLCVLIALPVFSWLPMRRVTLVCTCGVALCA